LSTTAPGDRGAGAQRRLPLAVKRIEKSVLGLAPVRWLVVAIEWFAMRCMWVWGRVRFGALVRRRGLDCVCHWSVDLKYPENIVLGTGVVIGVGCSIGAHSSVTLGDRVRLSRDVHLETAGLDFSGQPPFPHVSKPIVVEEGVWIGARATVLGGVTIGRHAVVAAGAIVTHDVPPFTVVGGIPARLLLDRRRATRD
jgi:maltose O-acetyltransferase